jgi:hypothetical protein
VIIALLLLLVPQDAPPPVADSPRVEAYAGPLREGRLELATLSKQELHDEALALAERLAARAELAAEPEVERAEAWYAIGLARGRAGAFEPAVAGLRTARGLAGSDGLGLDALYGSGTFLLRKAELARLEVPEIRERLGLPPLAAQPPGAAPGGPPIPQGPAQEAPDPLRIAREAYVAARAELVERWRGDPRDADTRANLELAVRRLRELDELRREREEQEKQQEQQDPQKDPEQQQDPKQQDPKQDPEDPPKQDPKQQDPQQQQDPQEPEDQKGDEPKDEPGEEQDPQEPEESSGDPRDRPGSAKPREEMTMTPEEIQRLLDQLRAIEERAEEVRAMLRERRRVPVKKDW